ncbi:MAG: aminopeptidase N [Desulfobacteraceae bacterium 4572_35.1]|nr:MAG: aminopeptidase N [Desulfobacteraceae bacterium 4572_35.1]
MTHDAIYLADYRSPAYVVKKVDLNFDLAEEKTRVEAVSSIVRAAGTAATEPLLLRGEGLELLALELNGKTIEADAYQLDDKGLVVKGVPQQFELRIVTQINPAGNSALEGLYLSSGNFCTQCEPEGFRRITYAMDRPDVMSLYTTTITADKAKYPVLLSNGNLVESHDLDGGRHLVRWEDPFPKPSYLFALVAGELVCREDHFTTVSGRDVLLQIYVEPRNQEKTSHAMESLKKAMQWDEQRFGFEYDLDRYMIVAVDDFNMGAMENKGLNVFNSKYVLASPATATDNDYLAIEGVIGHEYFHNWTGNRITCRDWFQLSLKEGLTVFRDQEFSADMNSAAVKRIEEVRLLQSHQFAEDSGPLSHPVRPESYVEINNFYTMTVYNKGAEVIRMLHTLLGQEQFMRGMRLYVSRHDGQAVTTDDFVAAMADGSGVDLTQFKRWYSQSGTPVVTVASEYDSQEQTLNLTVSQSWPATPDQQQKQPLQIPVRMALIAADGTPLPLKMEGGESLGAETVLHLSADQQTFTFYDVSSGAVPSLLRGFSAPVKFEMEQSVDDLAFLMACDNDPFNRWNAGQRLAVRLLLGLIDDVQQGRTLQLDSRYCAAFERTLQDEDSDPALLALALTLPFESYLAEQMSPIDPHAIHSAREFVRSTLAQQLRKPLLSCYRRCQDKIATLTAMVTETMQSGSEFVPQAVGWRSLKNVALAYLALVGDADLHDLVYAQYTANDNMTDVEAALTIAADIDEGDGDTSQQILSDFYQRWRNDPLVVDKWLAIQARAQRSDCLQRVQQLMDSDAFDIKNPNKVRSLIGVFCQGNPVNFHALDGAGYRFLQQQVAQLDSFNPQIAARLVTPLLRWSRYDTKRAAAMKQQLEKLVAMPDISADLYEVVNKGLHGGCKGR